MGERMDGNLEVLADAPGLEAGSGQQIVAWLIAFGVLVAEARVQHQDDDPPVVAENTEQA